MHLSLMFKSYITYLRIYKHADSARYVESHRKPIMEFFGDVDSSELTVERVQEFILMQQDRRLTSNTINKRVNLLKRICGYNKVGHLGFMDLPNLKVKFNTYGHLNEDAKAKLIKAMDKMTVHQKVIFRLLYETGLRRKELVGILLENIDFEKRSIHVTTTKTDKDRYVFFTPSTGRLLNRYIKLNKPSEYLFSHPDGKPLDPHAVTSLFQRVKKWSGIQRLSPHMLRHTFTTDLYDRGANLILIQGLLGHSDPKTTRRYVHADIDHDRNLYDKFMKSTNGLDKRALISKKRS